VRVRVRLRLRVWKAQRGHFISGAERPADAVAVELWGVLVNGQARLQMRPSRRDPLR
jgi:hypothetical protein